MGSKNLTQILNIKKINSIGDLYDLEEGDVVLVQGCPLPYAYNGKTEEGKKEFVRRLSHNKVPIANRDYAEQIKIIGDGTIDFVITSPTVEYCYNPINKDRLEENLANLEEAVK